MAKGLAISGVVNVTINLAPIAAQYRNFGVGLIMGSSDVIDTNELIRQYANIKGVAQDFGTTAPEYLAAALYFSQTPQPAILYIGRWAQAATKGRLNCGVLTPAEQVMSNFTSVTSGALKISVDGVGPTDITGIDLSSATNLNGVASILQTKISATFSGTTVVWDAVQGRFIIRSGTTGASSTVSYMTAPATGTSIINLLKGSSSMASSPVAGIVAETALAAVGKLADVSSQWYGLMFATATPPADADYLAVAAYIEASSPSRIFGVNIIATTVLDNTITSDIGSQLQALGYKRTFCQYSSSSPYAVASLMGRAFTVDFEANNTTITLKFKQEPGVAAEYLTETQAATLRAKNVNVFIEYDNSTAIIQEGVMANGYFFDEVHGTDWLQNAIQTDVWNLLYTTPTKIPQTDDGMHQIVTRIEKVCGRAVNNGLLAPGVWDVQGFGQIKDGDFLPKGYYVYAPLVSTQSAADRAARKSVPIQVAAKLAGAVHSSNILVNVNR